MKLDASFMQWQFKIAPCTKTYEHEWSTCPYVHEGEKMRRRDPRTHSCHACPLSKQKKPCPLGDACQHAHNVYECGFHPDRFRTKYCRSGATCRRWNCFFAHSVEELRDPQAASAAAATDGSDARASSLDTFSFGALEDSLPLLPTFSKHPHTAVGSSLGSFLPSSAGLATFTSASSGLCLPLLGPLPDMAGAATAGSNGGFLGLECSKSLVSSGSQSPGGSSSAMNSGSFSSCGVPSGGLLTSAINSSAMLSTSSGTLFNHDGLVTATSSCPVTMAPPAVTSTAYDHLLPADQQSQWLLQPGLLPAHMQWFEPQQAWQQQQPQPGRMEYPQHMQQQAPLAADQMAFQQLLAAPGGPMDTKKSDMLHVMAMALGMDLHALRQSS